MRFRLEQIASVLGVNAAVSGMATGWSIDSRTLQPGDFFFALRGPNHDGHDYVAAAFAQGASGAAVEHAVGSAGPQFVVTNTLAALQQIAAWARTTWGGDIVGITGSAGKTTTKDIVTDLISIVQPVGKTIGNFNNDVGLPLSLLRLPDEARVGVIEFGMNHAGEIRNLAAIALPRVGVVTNVGYAHIQNFDSIDGVAAAKRELVEALPTDGVAILNYDDARVRQFGAAMRGRSITFGLEEGADVRAEQVRFDLAATYFHVGAVPFTTRLTGRHSVSNVLAGIAAAGLYGAKPEDLQEAVASLVPGKMRGERFMHEDILIYNDCYNSNPDAVRAMLDVLRDTPARRRIAVLGEMLELGRWAEPLHRDIGQIVVSNGIDVLVGIRGAASHMVDAAMQFGASAAFFFDNPDEAGEFVRQRARPGDAILFKGSRGVRVERALAQFL
ncbi:MAG: UDP-N-acetylmuramoyl-tripeptide--D-alanyl-D-alanine ligase, partial [Bryobacteraceae bacterium]